MYKLCIMMKICVVMHVQVVYHDEHGIFHGGKGCLLFYGQARKICAATFVLLRLRVLRLCVVRVICAATSVCGTCGTISTPSPTW